MERLSRIKLVAVIYNPNTGVVTYDSDGSGAGQGVQITQLGVNLPITNADFVVI